ncbi:nucleotide exchange factor GrpE [Buchnera aphidicola]|uniref:Protein GrpE 2 n=1 Tax=Buchnera aphidicola subsp. Acyrthosiphon pisum (strain APS) TaxID=107806 RepID=GRPE2_BUCAI|nr:nucleotide exchange factor GrpE [Buchnera aphidicola]P57281.1 RecName: Full=Protein GrpE 2; AltName: Full=HSP-70 cofactor 2 [Buchnera aphidicola str. APS (Acyrthosiphon pisum)]pir/E84951/ heat shock protein grpE 2 [imported] - Buchnera sp. (strain APS) [Buchnera sp. (in: enterobacteria)]ADP66578.1 heat shock protein GrpE2 [Buchnera aphidicola str. TLW03 (Acyrthosiphon pisum)]ACL30003.1 heat shock protein GrpE2 [Buchnera aphidicola str. Tuc7 (Acyrthosiphon pisum)]ADP66008.1 heat shock protei
MDNKENKLDEKKIFKNNKIEEKKENLIDAITVQNQKIENLKLKLLQNQKKINDIELRKLANIENIKKNTEEKIEKIKKTEIERFLKSIIPVIDSLEDILNLSTTVDIKDQPIIKGIELTLESLLNILNKLGVKIEGQKNKVFNPDIHELVSRELSKETLPNHVISVNKKGFTFNKIVLRKASVIVAEN